MCGGSGVRNRRVRVADRRRVNGELPVYCFRDVVFSSGRGAHSWIDAAVVIRIVSIFVCARRVEDDVFAAGRRKCIRCLCMAKKGPLVLNESVGLMI